MQTRANDSHLKDLMERVLRYHLLELPQSLRADYACLDPESGAILPQSGA